MSANNNARTQNESFTTLSSASGPLALPPSSPQTVIVPSASVIRIRPVSIRARTARMVPRENLTSGPQVIKPTEVRKEPNEREIAAILLFFVEQMREGKKSWKADRLSIDLCRL
jgi:hypothetical protein